MTMTLRESLPGFWAIFGKPLVFGITLAMAHAIAKLGG